MWESIIGRAMSSDNPTHPWITDCQPFQTLPQLGPIYNNCFSAIFEYVQNLSNFKPLVSTHLNLLPKVFNILIALAMLQYELHSNSLHIFGITAHPNQCATTKIQVLLNQTNHKTIHEETGTKPSKRTVSDHRAAGTNLTSVFPPAFVNFSKRTLSHQLYHMIIFHPHPADFKIKFRDKIGREEGALECSLMTPWVQPMPLNCFWHSNNFELCFPG